MHYRQLIRQAIEQAQKGNRDGQTPFGAVIANDRGEIIVQANNTVRADCDSTGHAEINAIRSACRKVGRIDLSGYMMVTTCEPCPMCAAAVHWAPLDEGAFGATIDHAKRAGFHELSITCRTLYETGASQARIQEGVWRTNAATCSRNGSSVDLLHLLEDTCIAPSRALPCSRPPHLASYRALLCSFATRHRS